MGSEIKDVAAILQPEEQKRILHSLTAVGPHKPIGYLPLYTITDIPGIRRADLAAQARSCGLSSIVLPPSRCRIKSGALYVYDRPTLRRLLRRAAMVVRSGRLSTNPDRFVRQIAATWFEPGDHVELVIREAFGDMSQARTSACARRLPAGARR